MHGQLFSKIFIFRFKKLVAPSTKKPIETQCPRIVDLHFNNFLNSDFIWRTFHENLF